MPSGKKARARARRAAKEAKAMEEEKEGGSLMAINHDGSLVEALMQRLTIDDLLREDGMVQCRHGIELEPHEVRRCREFITVFDNAFQAKLSAGETDSASIFFAGIDATSNFADIWDSVTMVKKILSYCLALGTQYNLDGKAVAVRMYSYTSFFEQYIAVELEKTQPMVEFHKVIDVLDSRAMVSFFRKRIPCKCLDKKYKEVKTITTMAFCCNEECSLPDRKVERNKILYCSGCDQVCYCSRACQKAHWKEHKEICREVADLKAEFDAEKR